MNRFKQIKDHFEQEAAIFDKMFFRIVPYYEEAMEAILAAMPFNKTDKPRIIDMGCGTGNLTKKLAMAYPKAEIICLDMAENMLKLAKVKLSKYPNITYWQGDIRDFDYKGKYDAIVSSLVLHHVEKKGKLQFYKNLHKALRSGGVFYNFDILTSGNKHINDLLYDNWKHYMGHSGLSPAKYNEMIRRHKVEDRPVTFEEEMNLLQKAGFKNIDVIWRRIQLGTVYGAVKK
jgi:tRNA (cmo5U34)-methyltransferase